MSDVTTFTYANQTVNRLGFGAMRITGEGIWGPPQDPDECRAVLKRAVELGVNLIDTADSYGPYILSLIHISSSSAGRRSVHVERSALKRRAGDHDGRFVITVD